MKFNLTPLSRTLGAEITGLDLSRSGDSETRQALNSAWIEHAVLVIRGQKLSPPESAIGISA